MESQGDYDDLSFIPSQGTLFVDTSAVEFLGKRYQRDITREKLLHRVRLVYDVLLSREGDSLSSNEVLEEIITNRVFYKGISNTMIISNTMGCGNRRYGGKPSKKEIRLVRNLSRAFDDIYSFLKKSTNKLSLKLSPEIKDFLSQERYSRLSMPDKSLVGSALDNLYETGIFSSDGLLLTAYSDGVREFSLDNCFIADGISSRTIFY